MSRHVAITIGILISAATGVVAEDQVPPPANRPVMTRPAPSALSRVFIDANGGYQSSSLSFSDTRRDPWFGETASWTADYEVKSGPAFDAAGGVRVWGPLVARVGYSRFTDTRAAAIVGAIPHPFFFSRDRAIAGEAQGLKQEEQAIHVGALVLLPLSRMFEISIFGGPSFFRVKRDLVQDVEYSDTYPYDTANFTGTAMGRAENSGLGFHAGADLTYFFSRAVGIGAIVRFSQARVTLRSPAHSGSLPLDVGGLQAGGGLRFRFGGRSTLRRPERGTASSPTRRPVLVEPVEAPRDREAPTAPGEPASAPAPDEPKVREPAPPAAPGPAAPGTAAMIRLEAPIFISPDSKRTPLAILKPLTAIRLLEDRGEWLLIEFRAC